MTGNDRELLELCSALRLVLVDQVSKRFALEKAEAIARVDALEAEGLVKRERRSTPGPCSYRITRRGLAVAESDLRAPGFDPRSFWHDIAAGWLLVAALTGAFGDTASTMSLSERQMRRRDEQVAGRDGDHGPRPADGDGDGDGGGGGGDRMFGSPIAGVGSELWYPDVAVHSERGWVAIAILLSGGPWDEPESVLSAVSANPMFAVLLCLVQDPAAGRRISSTATRLGLDPFVSVQLLILAKP